MASPAPVSVTRAIQYKTTHRPALMRITLLLSDMVSLTVAVLLGFRVWALLNPEIPEVPEIRVVVQTVSFAMAVLAFQGSYPAIGLTAVAQLRRITHGVSLAYLLLATSIVMAKGWEHSSRGAFLLSWVFSLGLILGFRWVIGYWMIRQPWWGVPAIIIGSGETARLVIRSLNANLSIGYRPVMAFADTHDENFNYEGVPVHGDLDDLERYTGGVRCAIVAISGIHREWLLSKLERWSSLFPQIIIIVPELTGVASLWTEPRDMSGLLAFETRYNLLNPLSRWMKRAADVILAALGMIVAVPIVAAAALWIHTVSPGSPFYTQEREGKAGKRIRILKLRTMYPNAEIMLERHLEQVPSAREEWERFCKLKDDPRILPSVGMLLRSTSLDELPQLWNVFKGEMSLVGPRPFPLYHNQRFSPDFRALRTQVTPGLTGLWQVSARSNGDLGVQQSLDTYYIRNWSPWLDLYILARTARTVLVRDGAC